MRVGPLEQAADGTRLWVKAVPRASRSEIAGIHGDMVRIRVAAPPVDGAANEELVRFLAAALAVPRNTVSVVSGQASRSKVIRISGLTMEQVHLGLGL